MGLLGGFYQNDIACVPSKIDAKLSYRLFRGKRYLVTVMLQSKTLPSHVEWALVKSSAVRSDVQSSFLVPSVRDPTQVPQ